MDDCNVESDGSKLFTLIPTPGCVPSRLSLVLGPDHPRMTHLMVQTPLVDFPKLSAVFRSLALQVVEILPSTS